MRITINDRAGRVLEKLKADCSERKITTDDVISIVSEAIVATPQSFWREQIERHTPASYLLEKALKDPKLSKQVAEFLKTKMSENPTVRAGDAGAAEAL